MEPYGTMKDLQAQTKERVKASMKYPTSMSQPFGAMFPTLWSLGQNLRQHRNEGGRRLGADEGDQSYMSMFQLLGLYCMLFSDLESNHLIPSFGSEALLLSCASISRLWSPRLTAAPRKGGKVKKRRGYQL